MDTPKIATPSVHKFPRSIGQRLVRQLRTGTRLAYQAPPPAWKTKQKGYSLGIWFDVTVSVSLIVLVLLGGW